MKLVQYIKLARPRPASAPKRFGARGCRWQAEEREEVLALVREAIRTRPGAEASRQESGRMKIRRIRAYRVELPLHEGSYKWSGGKSVSVFDSTVVEVETDAGLVGYGEVCPLGPFYLPAYANGVRAGLAELGPHLIGEDPLQLGKLNRRMDAALKGHAYVKSGDRHGLLGHPRQGDRPAGLHAAGRPLRRRLPSLSRDLAGIARRRWPAASPATGPRATAVSSSRSAAIRAVDVERIRAVADRLQPGDRLIADANTGWLMHDALRVVRAVRDVDVYIEQPCLSYEECLTVRRHSIIRSCSTR